jgi:hypothetical protein
MQINGNGQRTTGGAVIWISDNPVIEYELNQHNEMKMAD